MALASLKAGKNVFLEKPISTTLEEAEELISESIKNNVKFTIGYSQRFNAKYAYVKKSLQENIIGEPVTCLVSRHITRELGEKISGRTALSPAAMESTHDLDFLLWKWKSDLAREWYPYILNLKQDLQVVSELV